jgi:PIN domain nuclease of toxin-antitoxin system
MRYYLDTNILVFILSNQKDEIDREVTNLLDDCSNSFFVCSVVIQELLLLHKKGKFKKPIFKTPEDILFAIDESGYEVVSINKKNLLNYAKMDTPDTHKDPNYHMIIAQSISDKIPVISSEHKFKLYESQGLQLVFNKR